MTPALYAPKTWPTERIAIDLIGAGGTGSQVADQLASLETTLRALGHPGFDVVLHDGDEVSRSNIGRQRFTAHDIGLSKAIVLVHRINGFYGLDWRASPQYVKDVRYGLRSARLDGLVITCVDKAVFRGHLGKAFKTVKTEALWLDMGNGDREAQCVIGHLGRPSDQDRIPNIHDLYPELLDMAASDQETPSCSAEEAVTRQPWPINRVVAMAGMELLWDLLRKGNIAVHGQFITLGPMQMTPLRVGEDHWALLGYAPRRKRSPARPGHRPVSAESTVR